MELKATQIRASHDLRTLREQVRDDLEMVLKATRNEESYIALADIAEIIRQELGDEALTLKEKI